LTEGSKNKVKARLAAAILHEKISDQRNDFQHGSSSKLISENQELELETLNVSSMLKNHCLAQSIADASWISFLNKLEYKAEWYKKLYHALGNLNHQEKSLMYVITTKKT